MGAGKTSILSKHIPRDDIGLSRTMFITSSNNADRAPLLAATPPHSPSSVFVHNEHAVGGCSIPCKIRTVKTLAEVSLSAFRDVSTVLIDEAQFYPDLFEWVMMLRKSYPHVVIHVAGLITDWKGDQFGQLLNLIMIAESHDTLAADCTDCLREGRITNAIYSRKCVDQRSDKTPVSDPYAKYEPVCFNHFHSLD